MTLVIERNGYQVWSRGAEEPWTVLHTATNRRRCVWTWREVTEIVGA
jgi:hypothetical protein